MESSRKLIILLVTGVIVAFAAIAIRNRMGNDEPQPTSNRVVIAKRDISPGTLVQVGPDIDWAELPDNEFTRNLNKEELLREGIAHIEDFNGAVARKQLRPGDPLTTTDLTRAGEGGFMSAVLEPGMRAVSIGVNATSGNAGFISPGDRVDLIVTHRVRSSQGKQNTGDESVVSETFVRNVRVLAVDQMLDNPENKAILAKTVTVEVDARQAEQISVAQEMGKISMVLRSLDTKGVTSNAAAEDAASDLYGQSAQGKDVPRIRVIRGDASETVEFY